MALTRVGEPRHKGPRAPFIRRLKPQETYYAQVLGSAPHPYYMHWLPKADATMPCLADREPDGTVINNDDCDHCKNHCPERWRCYLHVWNGHLEREEFLEMTWRCWNAAKCFLPPGQSLRGWQITAQKGKGVKTKTQVKFDFPSKGVDVTRLPVEKSPEIAFDNTMTL